MNEVAKKKDGGKVADDDMVRADFSDGQQPLEVNNLTFAAVNL